MIEFKLLKQLTEAFPIGFSDEKRRQVNPMTGKDASPSDVKKEIIKDKEHLPNDYFTSRLSGALEKRWHREVELRVKRYNLDNPDSRISVSFNQPERFRNLLVAKSGTSVFSTFDIDSKESTWNIPKTKK